MYNKQTNVKLLKPRYIQYLDKRIQKDYITNATKLYYELNKLNYIGKYHTVYRYVRFKLRELNRDIKPSRRVETPPGKQVQIDWGYFGKIEVNERLERLYCFVYLLSYSRIMHAQFTISQNLQTLQECLMNAFEALGIPKSIRHDNMKTIVLRREKIQNKNIIHYHPAFLDFAQYYGFRLDPTPPYWPRAKGKVEAGVKFIRNNFMQGMKFKRDFKSLDEINKKIKVWLKDVANNRIHGTTKEKPIDRWLIEKDILNFPTDLPRYPTSPFIERHSNKEGTVDYKCNFYSVPSKYALKKLFIRKISDNGIAKLEIYYKDSLITTHIISPFKNQWIEKDEHRKQKHSFISLKQRQSKKLKAKQKNLHKYPKIIIRPVSYYDQFVGL